MSGTPEFVENNLERLGLMTDESKAVGRRIIGRAAREVRLRPVVTSGDTVRQLWHDLTHVRQLGIAPAPGDVLTKGLPMIVALAEAQYAAHLELWQRQSPSEAHAWLGNVEEGNHDHD